MAKLAPFSYALVFTACMGFVQAGRTEPVGASVDRTDFQGPAVEMVGPTSSYARNTHSNDDILSSSVGGNGWWRLLEYYNLTDSCQPLKFSISVEQKPKHGEVAIVDSDFEFKKFADTSFSAIRNGVRDPRGACTQQNYPAKLAIYKMNAGYNGTDELVIVITDGKYTSHERIRIVAKP
jgi:hypothetical protein